MDKFDIWFKKRHLKTGLYEKSLVGDEDAIYIRHEMRKAYLAGKKVQQKIAKISPHVIIIDSISGNCMITIMQDYIKKFTVEEISTGTRTHLLLSHGFGDELEVDLEGAKALSAFLNEFIKKSECKD